MSANPLPSTDNTIFIVREWKETLDPHSKWWQRWFHRFIYLPFNEFSLKVMKIPTVSSATISGDEVRFSWLEDCGFFSSEHEAEMACLNGRTSYQGVPFGRLFPDRSCQCLGPTIFPRAQQPRKRARPVLGLVFKTRKQEEDEQQAFAKCVKQLSQILDR